jgi:hypothetical protein
MRLPGFRGGGLERSRAGAFRGVGGGCPNPGGAVGPAPTYSARTSAPCDSNGAWSTSAQPSDALRTASTTAPVCS